MQVDNGGFVSLYCFTLMYLAKDIVLTALHLFLSLPFLTTLNLV